MKLPFSSLVCLLLVTVPVYGQTEPESSDPLEITTPDPLLPQPPVPRPLSPLEKFRLGQNLDQLNQQATLRWKAGDIEEAFTIWYRELRLRRSLGYLEEVKALGRVGAVAWGENRREDLQRITQRLQEIEAEAKEEGSWNTELLYGFGQAYEQLRFPKSAENIYEEILVQERQEADQGGITKTLQTLASLHLAWFNYSEAAIIYEELLEIARSQLDQLKVGVYLRQLVYIYDQNRQPEKAFPLKQQLAEYYVNQENQTQLATLKLSIAQDYAALNQPENASQTYQDAFELAWSMGQVTIASDALKNLAELYYQYEQPEYAIQIYQELIKVDQQSSDFYGLMNTYDRIGEIYLAENQYEQALNAFQEGLVIAQSLSYQETYFLAKIERVNGLI